MRPGQPIPLADTRLADQLKERLTRLVRATSFTGANDMIDVTGKYSFRYFSALICWLQTMNPLWPQNICVSDFLPLSVDNSSAPVTSHNDVEPL
jgi:hypothetical protein